MASIPRAKIANITPQGVQSHLDDGNIVIVAGFQGETSRRPHHHARPRRLGSHRHRHRRRREGRPLPDLHRCGWRLHLRPARGPHRAQAAGDFVRRDAGARRQRSQSHAVALRRVRQKIRRRFRSPLLLQPKPRHSRERRNHEHGASRRPRRLAREKSGQGHRRQRARPARHCRPHLHRPGRREYHHRHDRAERQRRRAPRTSPSRSARTNCRAPRPRSRRWCRRSAPAS